MKRFLTALVFVACLPSMASAQITQLFFDGFLNNESIEDYYNGGLAGFGTGPGPAFGVTFGSNALAITSQNAGGTGNFQGNPSGTGIMFWLSGSNTFMNVAGGFDTGFSLFYSAVAGFSGNVSVWDDFDGTGNLLGSVDLPAFASGLGSPGCTLSGAYCPWRSVGVGFTGMAQSVSFGGSPNFIGFDNITFGSIDPGTDVAVIPEPATVYLMGSGFLLLAGMHRRRRLKIAAT